ncbi:hypothetical protein GIB67_019896 [Kingdonia uniflora]|uniref:methionine--tRNA ligase n=1 Tax=Kingdonia uniflora TaxID=39325 RepID=A0A7J7MKS3_9MAGN|nr:hypothetical protein GIB67_019896 [Kingdonia uniflora]
MEEMVVNAKVPKLPITGSKHPDHERVALCQQLPSARNLIGSVLSADVFARFCRLRGHNALYICGTDEYGTTTEVKAMEENCSPKEICDKYHAIHKEVYEWFDISFDEFGRTSTPRQTEVCHAIYDKLMEKKLLSENTVQQVDSYVNASKFDFQIIDFCLLLLQTTPQLYCETCKRFLADRFVEGICPTPGCNKTAQGDQCDSCKRLLNPTELMEPKCKVMFPSTLLGTEEKWTLMKTISVMEYLHYEGGKFSKSNGIGIFGNDAKDTKIPSEVWRYYLLINRPEVSCIVVLFSAGHYKCAFRITLKVLSFIAKPLG